MINLTAEDRAEIASLIKKMIGQCDNILVELGEIKKELNNTLIQ